MAAYKMQLEDWLDDLCVRFIINLPEEDLSSVARICFQIEEAQWFYEDFVRPLDPTLPSMTLRNFSLRIFQHCPLLAPFSVENHTRAFEEFLQYKTRVPVRGAILLNEDMDSTVLVKGWKKGANWSFPRGKINKDEDDLECAIREVYEETGYDLHAAGLVPPNRDVKHIEITMREQQMRLYVFRDVPMDTHFAPRTRKEISKISWYNLSELPAFRKKGNNQNDAAASAAAVNANKFYMVAPFLVPLKKWVVQQKKRDNAKNTQQVHFQPQNLYDEPVTEDDAWVQNKPTAAVVEHTPALDTLEGGNGQQPHLVTNETELQGHQPGSNVQSAQYQSPPAFWQQEASLSAHGSAQTGLVRSATGTEQHRSALLQMFKKPEGDIAITTGVAHTNQGSEAPEIATVSSKHTHGPGHSGVELNPLSSQPITQQAEQGSAAHQPNRADPSNLSRKQPNKGATQTPPFTILRRPEVLGHTTAPRQVSVNATLAAHRAIGQDKPSSLASPPATSSLPTPAALQRKESMSHEQRSKLLSLFGKPPSVAPATPDAAGRVPDSAAPETTSRSGSAASRGLPLLGQIAQDDAAESRRGSQTPISPADRNFLLSYLASATNNTK
ncbi:mRNA-decapping enzyme subunit 2 [Verticillium nonalfalfae]|uniref:mRNA-decapping enzyme subunit 2 n=1 Tax=Verticillium nonalfalfae TaxID=1051616 RepID=A0A3M9Y4K0_9PEZI|nr:mRNA-decapping enzyme subunit 2 [Verticillium nonalfalfae]RNJ55224.1 mRNA-decapping enzyme subunit 2 [Verticillium nonalfalfae]